MAVSSTPYSLLGGWLTSNPEVGQPQAPLHFPVATLPLGQCYRLHQVELNPLVPSHDLAEVTGAGTSGEWLSVTKVPDGGQGQPNGCNTWKGKESRTSTPRP